MRQLRWVSFLCTVGIMLTGGIVCAQEYPTKAIRIVTGSTGSGSDVIARLIATGISGSLGQPVVIDNRQGATMGQTLTQAAPDGYTVLLGGGSVWIEPLLHKTPYDPLRDFSPVILISIEPQQLVVHPSLPAKNVKELIALAKARPGQLNCGSGGAGGAAQLASDLFKSMAGVNIVSIPYKDVGQGLTDLIAGHVQMRFAGSAAATPHVKAGRLRALGVTSAQPSALFPGLPTIGSTVPGYEAVSMTAVFVPTKTPQAIANRLNEEITRVLARADVKENLMNAGQDIVGGTPEQLGIKIKSDMAKWDKIIRDAGIKAD